MLNVGAGKTSRCVMKNFIILISVVLLMAIFLVKTSSRKLELGEIFNKTSPDEDRSLPVVLSKVGKSDLVRKDLGFDPTSQASMSKYWNERLETNETHVTNTHILSTNGTVVRVTSWQRNKHWGTDGWEVYSKIMYQEGCEMDLGQSQIIDLLNKYPGARDSTRLFTGAYATTFILKLIQEHIQLSNSAEINFDEKMKSSWIVDEKDPAMRETLVQLEMEMRQESIANQRDAINDLKARHWNCLKELYGDFPKDLFQQMMALEYKFMF
jgi:hypothetical protein